MSTIEKKHATINEQSYYEWLKPIALEKSTAVDIYGTTRDYLNDFNLEQELDRLPNGTVVYDVGCAHGGAVIGLEERFPQYQFIGIDSVPVQRFDGNKFPFVQGNLTELPFVLQTALPPQVIMVRNTLQVIYFYESQYGESGLLQGAIKGIADTLPLGTKALIYDNDLGQLTYDNYQHIINKNGFPLACEVLEGCGELISYPYYLRMQKK